MTREHFGPRTTERSSLLSAAPVQIYTPMHPLNSDLRRREEFGKRIDIGSDVWVGGGAMVLPGVRIGSRARRLLAETAVLRTPTPPG